MVPRVGTVPALDVEQAIRSVLTPDGLDPGPMPLITLVDADWVGTPWRVLTVGKIGGLRVESDESVESQVPEYH